MWSIGVLSFVLIEIHMWTQVIWKYFLKKIQKWLIFKTLSLISPSFHMVCLQPNAWLESYDRYGSFGTMIWGSLIVSPLIWFFSSRNTSTLRKLYLLIYIILNTGPVIALYIVCYSLHCSVHCTLHDTLHEHESGRLIWPYFWETLSF